MNDEINLKATAEDDGNVNNNPEDPTEPENPDTPDDNEQVDEWKDSFLYPKFRNFYERVRFNLGSQGSILTDEQIDFPENAPDAELTMRVRVPDWESLDNFNATLYETCIVYMTCYNLCFVVHSSGDVIAQKTPALELQFGSVNLPQRPCDRFLMLVDDLVAKINGEERHSMLGFEVTPSQGTCFCRRVLDRWNVPLGSE